MPSLKTKAERRVIFGPPPWMSKAEAAAVGDESLWSVDQKIKRGEYIARKDPDTGTVKVWRPSVEKNPNDSEFNPPTAA